jgi:hypothetical protein
MQRSQEAHIERAEIEGPAALVKTRQQTMRIKVMTPL